MGFVGTGSAGRRGRVEAERAVAALAHRRGRAGAGAVRHDDTGEYPVRK